MAKKKTKKKDIRAGASSSGSKTSSPVQNPETEIHREIIRVEAEGNVKIVMKNRIALSGKAIYDAKSRLITLTGSPRVWRGKDFLSGDRITVYLDEDRSVIESGLEKKVKATFYQPSREAVKPGSGKSSSEVKE